MTTPLIDEYRKTGTFDPKLFKNVVEGEDYVEIKKDIVARMKADPVFRRDYHMMSRQEYREAVHRRWKAIQSWKLFTDPYEDVVTVQSLSEVLEAYDQATSARFFLHTNVFAAAIKSMGTERHQEIIRMSDNNEIVGAFCLTEVSHGSNTAEVQTTATYMDGSIVFNTPHVGAIKCWAGNLAHSATHVVVFAQLYVKNKCEGFHGFIVQVRDLKTFETLPGITIGDMGSKPGAWQGVENGWLEFKNHKAPLSSLLNKGCDILPDGTYTTTFKSVSEKKSVSLGTLSIGRIGIIGKGMMACIFASTIAIRYSVARRQFGPKPGAENEIPVLEYPLQQFRLFPYLVSAICLRIFQRTFFENFTEYMMRVMQGEKSDELMEYSKEVHALSSGGKPVATWLGVEALTEARRACGGHGFLHLSRLNQLRDDNDPSQTFEGENYMILQQTSNILLAKAKSGNVSTPMGTMQILNKDVPKFSKWSNCAVKDSLQAFAYLINYLIHKTQSEIEGLNKTGKSSFDVRNQTQIHRAMTLSICYTQHTMIKWCQDFINTVDDKPIKTVLQKVLALFALFTLERHLSTLYISGYCSDGKFGEELQEKLRNAVSQLKPDAMTLVDAIAPDDFILHSALGESDGRAYDHMLEEFRKHTNEKPGWLHDLSQTLQSNSQKSKL